MADVEVGKEVLDKKYPISKISPIIFDLIRA
jgi:hypothetical protein